ncbi:MAG: hypothetical protein CM15mP68_5730 [Pseudomonadota bacterium]|nr:MAG: hypothetical protein CM15mP68_5730 [Pseudomonadota bacterium]
MGGYVISPMDDSPGYTRVLKRGPADPNFRDATKHINQLLNLKKGEGPGLRGGTVNRAPNN